jgi:AcrR family transcriptional regulator
MARRKGFALTREAVVAAAITLGERDGPGQLGVNAVARELGIKPPSLYNHVASGEALQQAVAIEGTRRLGDYLGQQTSPTKQTAKRTPQSVEETYDQLMHILINNLARTG